MLALYKSIENHTTQELTEHILEFFNPFKIMSVKLNKKVLMDFTRIRHTQTLNIRDFINNVGLDDIWSCATELLYPSASKKIDYVKNTPLRDEEKIVYIYGKEEQHSEDDDLSRALFGDDIHTDFERGGNGDFGLMDTLEEHAMDYEDMVPYGELETVKVYLAGLLETREFDLLEEAYKHHLNED